MKYSVSDPLSGLDANTYNFVNETPIITVYFPTIAILNGQFGRILNFSTHGLHVRVWTH